MFVVKPLVNRSLVTSVAGAASPVTISGLGPEPAGRPRRDADHEGHDGHSHGHLPGGPLDDQERREQDDPADSAEPGDPASGDDGMDDQPGRDRNGFHEVAAATPAATPAAVAAPAAAVPSTHHRVPEPALGVRHPHPDRPGHPGRDRPVP
ncbi:hypothetical protein ABZ815_02815 [Nonomuraea sp. NPDC047529]|uniref:hypothetical protein n=1 Tax=Nonomuraea sp. NPDC047529 TaxID=3155623 RepID=UPI003404C38B